MSLNRIKPIWILIDRLSILQWLFHSPDNMTWSIQHVSGLFLDVDSKDVGLHADQTEAKIWQIESALTGNINTTYFM